MTTESRTSTATSEPTATTGTALQPPTGVGYEEAFPGLPAFQRPVALVEVPGQAYMLLALQEGLIVGFPKDGPYNEPQTVHDQRGRTLVDQELGLLALAFDPDFRRNHSVYLYYSPNDGERRTVLSRLMAQGEGTGLALDPASEEILLEVPQPYPNHNGGQLLFGPDGMLYLGLGDGGAANDPHGNGQDTQANLLGSIIRIDVSQPGPDAPYSIPADNPFAGGGALPETWAYGFRNPWRMSFDRETGDLWVGDVGQDAFEEIDVVVPGANHGWNLMEGTECFEPPEGCDQQELALPVAVYGHDEGCSVSGGYVYRGEAFASLRGWYLYGDYCSGNVWALDAEAAVRGSGVTPVPLWTGPGISSFAEDADGELYFLAYEEGKVYRVTAGG